MGENVKLNEKCIKGNTAYFKIKIDSMIEYEINKFGADQGLYNKLGSKISQNFANFSDKLISGSDFNQIMTKLRDDVIEECAKIDNDFSSNTPKMRPFFKDYIFDKIYTMGINIKKGMLPEDCENELEEARLKLEEEAKQKEQEEQEKNEKEELNNISVTVENSEEEKDPDVIDLMWNYFFGGSKSSSSKTQDKSKENKEDKEGKEDKNKIKN